VNLEVNDLLVNAIKSFILSRKPARVIDLYGGAGNLSMCIAAESIEVAIVESNGAAAKDARYNARKYGLRVEVLEKTVETFEPGETFYDTVIADPPRSGSKGLLSRVCITRPKTVVLVSCRPASFAEDLQLLLREGYYLEGINLYDMFPLTSHVESVAFLARSCS